MENIANRVEGIFSQSLDNNKVEFKTEVDGYSETEDNNDMNNDSSGDDEDSRDSSSDKDNNKSFALKLKAWASKHGVKDEAVDDLLDILRKYHTPNLPRNSKELHDLATTGNDSQRANDDSTSWMYGAGILDGLLDDVMEENQAQSKGNKSEVNYLKNI